MPDDPAAPALISTTEYLNFMEFCEACTRDRYIGLCYGKAGVGKTLSASHYAGFGTVSTTATAIATSWSFFPERQHERVSMSKTMLESNTVFYTPEVVNTPSRVVGRLAELRSQLTLFRLQVSERYGLPTGEGHPLKDVTQLIIVDEADRLTVPSLEQLRDMYDRQGVGLVLMGVPGFEKKLARYPQFYSRVGFVHLYRNLRGDELRSILIRYWNGLGLEFNPATDEEAMADITRMTDGNFRLIHRLFSQIARVIQTNLPERRFTTITKELIKMARESLVIGAD